MVSVLGLVRCSWDLCKSVDTIIVSTSSNENYVNAVLNFINYLSSESEQRCGHSGDVFFLPQIDGLEYVDVA